MSYAAINKNDLEQTSARLRGVAASDSWSTGTSTNWRGLWTEVFRTQAIKELPQTTTTVAICFVVEALPIREMRFEGTTLTMLAAIENIFGDSATNMAKILRVSRPMIYHYRQGMEPSIENKRRLQTLAALASDSYSQVSRPLRGHLKAKQPEGRTLLDLLSDEDLDVAALRRMVQRTIAIADRALRNNLATELSREETADTRRDIIRERHAVGKPVYVGNADAPGELIQILPGGRRVRGRMVKRQFVPDEK